MGKPGGILTIGIGVALLYVAYTGYLSSAWNGLKGNCTGTKTAGEPEPQTAGEGPPSAASKVVYIDSPTGGLRATNAGMW